MNRQRRKFTREQKLEAVRKIEDGEKTLSDVSRDFDLRLSPPVRGEHSGASKAPKPFQAKL